MAYKLEFADEVERRARSVPPAMASPVVDPKSLAYLDGTNWITRAKA